MTTFHRKLLIAGVVLCVLALPVLAKRGQPKPVPPVISGGIRYSAEGNGVDEYVVAADISSDKELWRIKVFHVEIDSSLEEDVQLVYITDLKPVDRSKSILIRDEKSRCYLLDFTRRHVTKQQCGGLF
jgi:hypothetical protein